jgi:hypothetical protein
MNWNLVMDDQMGLTIAADARFSHPDYVDDQVWELRRVNSEPACLAVQTTFGLRAYWARFFPIFTRREVTLSDPSQFFNPPTIKNVYSNYLSAAFAPFPGIEVLAEYWAADSHLLAGRLRIANQSVLTESFRFEWAGSLNPIGDGEKLVTAQMGTSLVLRGRSKGFFTLCGMTGNPQGQHSPFNSLFADIEIFPGNFRLFNWAAATVPNPDEGLEMVRKSLALAWDAEISRIELQNSSQILEINTGIPAWDRAFDAAQKSACGLLMPGTPSLPGTSFVTSRNPDQGFSLRRDGTDYTHHWNGQTPLDSLYLSSLLLPGGSEVCKNLVQNFLDLQEENGFIDLKPGLAGQRTRQLAQPVLATLALQVAPYLPDEGSAWLAKIYPALLKFFECWFRPEFDRDGDGFPEWSHPQQTGLGDSPLYDVWHEGSLGVNIQTLESPALASFLFRECQSLTKIAHKTGQEEKLLWLLEKGEFLKKALLECWQEQSRQFRCRDFKGHGSPDGKELVNFTGSGKFRVRRVVDGLQRLNLKLEFEDENTKPVRIQIVGLDENGTEAMEEAGAREVIRGQGQAFYTTRQLFKDVKSIEVSGLGENDRGTLATVDYSLIDISMLLPLWSGALEGEQLKGFIEDTILLQYIKPKGCPAVSLENETGIKSWAMVHLPWNQLVGEGLVACGYRKEAADLFTRLMDASAKIFQETGMFRDHFDALDGTPGGEQNTLHSLPPLGLLLKTLGILKITPWMVVFEGGNPFPFPVTVKYRGMKVTRHASDTVVTFPGGQTVTVPGDGIQQVTID